MTSHRLGRLHDLAVFLTAEQNLDARLGELARHAAEATGAAACSIMLLSEGENEAPRLKLWASTDEVLPASAWKETAGPGESIAGKVLERGAALLIADIRKSEFAAHARRRGDDGASFICAPIPVGSRIIGVINLSGRAGAPPFGETDLATAGIVATLIGKSVQVERLETLLRSRVAQLTLAREEREVANRLTDGAMPPSRLAKMLAKAFYQDLAAAGFESGQIVEAASEIITQISGDIARAKKRIAGRGK